MPKEMPVKSEKMQIGLQDGGKRYIELLKNGKVKCSDFTDETLKVLLEQENVDLNDFPTSVKVELMYRQVIPADLTSLEASDQLKLLLCDECYGFSTPQLAAQIKWEEFTPDMRVRLLKYHPDINEHCPDWDWKSLAKASKAAWLYLFERNHYYAEYCPQETLASFTPFERFKTAYATPGLAAALDLSVLPLQLQDALLLRRPELAGFFALDQEQTWGELFLQGSFAKCYEKELEAVSEFISELLPHFPGLEEFGVKEENFCFLGIFSKVRGELLALQIRDFLEKNYIPDSEISVDWESFEDSPVAPLSNLETRILQVDRRHVGEACMDGETLSRIDLLLTTEFEMLRSDMKCLVLMKALSPELRCKALDVLTGWEESDELMALVKAACDFDPQQKRTDAEETLLAKVRSRDVNVLRELTGKVKISRLSADEALEIQQNCKALVSRNFFKNSVTPLLRAFLITELEKLEDSEENVDLINILLKPYWDDDDDDEFGEFFSDDLED